MNQFCLTSWITSPGSRGRFRNRRILDTSCWACERKSFRAISMIELKRHFAGWCSSRSCCLERCRRWCRRSRSDSCSLHASSNCNCDCWQGIGTAESSSSELNPSCSSHGSRDCKRRIGWLDDTKLLAERLPTHSWECEWSMTSDPLLWSSLKLMNIEWKLLRRQGQTWDSREKIHECCATL